MLSERDSQHFTPLAQHLHFGDGGPRHRSFVPGKHARQSDDADVVHSLNMRQVRAIAMLPVQQELVTAPDMKQYVRRRHAVPVVGALHISSLST